MIGIAAVAMLVATAPKHIEILFVGNSHTEHNNLPGMLQHLLESDGSKRRIDTYRYFDPFLNDASRDQRVRDSVVDPKWDIIVFQAAKASSSHKVRYNNDGGAELARMALKAGSRALFFVEWPRRSWDESEFQMGVYKPIQTASPGSEIVPICYAWDSILKKDPKLELWEPDGNHASVTGTFLASYVFYYYLVGDKRTPKWVMPGVDTHKVPMIQAAAKSAASRAAKHPFEK